MSRISPRRDTPFVPRTQVSDQSWEVTPSVEWDWCPIFSPHAEEKYTSGRISEYFMTFASILIFRFLSTFDANHNQEYSPTFLLVFHFVLILPLLCLDKCAMWCRRARNENEIVSRRMPSSLLRFNRTIQQVRYTMCVVLDRHDCFFVIWVLFICSTRWDASLATAFVDSMCVCRWGAQYCYCIR
jgi:hypothetical protein